MHLGYAKDRGLAEAIALNWRPESERRLSHRDRRCPGLSGSGGNCLARAARLAETQGQHVSTVMVARRDAETVSRQLAAAGFGEFVDGVGEQSMIARALLARSWMAEY